LLLKTITKGKGTYGYVVAGQLIGTNEMRAIKVIHKNKIKD